MPSEGPMKELPMIQLPPSSRLTLPFSPSELLRYPMGGLASPPGTPKVFPQVHLPPSLASDPRLWSREDVAYFLRWCETEFDLPNFDMDLFQMNGKALCFLTKADLNERCSGSGGVIHNVLQMLIRDTSAVQRSLPASPVTPTSRGMRYPFPSLPYSSWYLSELYNAHNAAAMMNSATLSPAPSTDSTSRSPDHSSNDNHASSGFGSGGSTGSHPSDSEEDTFADTRPPSAPPARVATPPVEQPPTPRTPTQPPVQRPQQQHFFPPDLQPEPNTNGRLLWDFLQQLLNDSAQRYTSFIAWKNQETGVFKIVDPAGLAKLWGIQKNHLSMNYDKMSRALRYYYRVNILRKVQGERHCYQFLRNPSELKSIKNISLLRQQISLQKQQQLASAYNMAATKPEPDMPFVKSELASAYNMAATKSEAEMQFAMKCETEPEVELSYIKREPEDNEPTDLSTPKPVETRCDRLRVSIVKSE